MTTVADRLADGLVNAAEHARDVEAERDALAQRIVGTAKRLRLLGRDDVVTAVALPGLLNDIEVLAAAQSQLKLETHHGKGLASALRIAVATLERAGARETARACGKALDDFDKGEIDRENAEIHDAECGAALERLARTWKRQGYTPECIVDEAIEHEAYAVGLQNAARALLAELRNGQRGRMPQAISDAMDVLANKLAENPNPSGLSRAEASRTHEASGPVGLGSSSEVARVEDAADAARWRWWCKWWLDERDDMEKINDLDYENDQASLNAAVDAGIAADEPSAEGQT